MACSSGCGLLVRLVLIKPALREQHTTQQQRRIHRGQLDPRRIARASIEMQEVIEETVVTRHALLTAALRRVMQESQGGQRAFTRLLTTDPATLDTQRIRSQCKTNCRYAGKGLVPRHAIRRKSIIGAGFLPEVIEGAALDVAQQFRHAMTAFRALSVSSKGHPTAERHRLQNNQQTQHRSLNRSHHPPKPHCHRALHRTVARR